MILENYDPPFSEVVSDIFCAFAADKGVDIGYDGSLDFTEMDRLEEMIKEKHPDWGYTRRELNGGRQIYFLPEGGNIRLSAILHRSSYGHERGLIEFWDRESDPVIVDAEYALILFERALKETENTLSFVGENLKTLMDNAKIPEGLRQKIMELEGLKCEEKTSGGTDG